jgi:hypothetical protein
MRGIPWLTERQYFLNKDSALRNYSYFLLPHNIDWNIWRNEFPPEIHAIVNEAMVKFYYDNRWHRR